jgi:ATP:cob(I)alamin adenosyltransferase
VIGIARLHSASNPELDSVLGRIQNDLFDVGADLCMPGTRGKGPAGARLTVSDAQVDWLEGEIDKLNAMLAPLQSFILPGGSPSSAYLHLARRFAGEPSVSSSSSGTSPRRTFQRQLSNTSTVSRIFSSLRVVQ